MKSYQMLRPAHPPEVAERIRRVVNKLAFLGLVVITAQQGQRLSIRVEPNAATQLLKSVYTGQGWEAGRMYTSYAAVMDGIKIIWHKPMRAPSASKVIRRPGQGYRWAARR